MFILNKCLHLYNKTNKSNKIMKIKTAFYCFQLESLTKCNVNFEMTDEVSEVKDLVYVNIIISEYNKAFDISNIFSAGVDYGFKVLNQL